MEFNGKADEDVFHVEHGNVGDHVISDDLARQVATVEHQDRFMQALRKCLNAARSVLPSICTIMGVYKIILMSSLFAQPAFKGRSGTYKATSDDYQASASCQNYLSHAVSVGTILGNFADAN